MNGRKTALISTISNTFCDFALDTAISRYPMYKIVFLTTIVSTIFQLFYVFMNGISITVASIPIVLAYGIFTLLRIFFLYKSYREYTCRFSCIN